MEKSPQEHPFFFFFLLNLMYFMDSLDLQQGKQINHIA